VLNIRTATIEDIPLIRQLTFKVWPQTYATLLSQEQIDYMLELMYSEASLKQQMESGSRFIIAYDENDPVGFASYQEIKPAIWKLHKLYILSSQQGKGSGRFVIDHIIKEIGQQKARALQLQVKKDNKAKKFYDKIGFSVIEEIRLDIGNGYVMDDYIMEKTI
jgi:ribosomal protein S18 acetylase RimI-like enzyme